jgi:hypothetical protein
LHDWEAEHGPETSVSVASLDFLPEDDVRGDDVNQDDEDEDEDDDNHRLLKNSASVSGLTAAGLGSYMPKYNSDYSSLDSILSPDGYIGGLLGDSDPPLVMRPPSPPLRLRDDDDDHLLIRPMEQGSGWSSSTSAADILF